MSQLRMVRDCERLGAAAACTAARENIVYQVGSSSNMKCRQQGRVESAAQAAEAQA